VFIYPASVAKHNKQMCVTVKTKSVGTTVFCGKFSKFRGPVCQILWLTVANFPHIVTNFLWPLNPTKYAVFVAGNCNWQMQMSTKSTWNISDKLRSIVSTFFPLRPNRQSCISWRNHIYGHLKMTKMCHICPLITGQYRIPQNSAKT